MKIRIDWGRIILVVAIAASSNAFDQFTKEIARSQLAGQPQRTYLGDTFRLLFAENEGAFLSLGSDLHEGPRYWALTILPVLILTGLFFYTIFSGALNRQQAIAYSFILGGGISNVFDRLLYGKVVDFMNMGIGDLRTGIFNFADVSIMIGLAIMVPYMFRKPERAARREEQETGQSSLEEGEGR